MRAARLRLRACCAALLACACGGEVNLGQRSPPAVDDDANEAPDDPLHVPSQRVVPLAAGSSNDTLAVFADYLYFGLSINSGQQGLWRCDKHDCGGTLLRVPNVTEDLATLRVHEQRLVVTGGVDEAWIGSYALPDVTDRQVVIDRLPRTGWFTPLFHQGYAFWSLSTDQSTYRCALPDCPDGPTKIGPAFDSSAVQADGDLIFMTDSVAILRSAELGDAPLQRLRPDATLSPAPEDVESFERNGPVVDKIETSAGMLYAVVSTASSGCAGCGTTLARWPVTGGEREELLVTQDHVSEFFVFGSELVWLAPRAGDEDRSTLSTCRLEACSATRRHLGQVRSTLRGIAADKERLYWLQTTRIDPDNFSEIAIRSVELLPAP